MMNLKGKSALVTGAAKRLGRAIALALGQAGCNVVVHHGHSPKEAAEVAAQIRAAGVDAWDIQADLADPAAIDRLFTQAGKLTRRLDILVNNAGVYERTPLETLTADQWDAMMILNARAPALCIRHALPLMTNGGAIINITDIAAEKAFAGYPAYCASKAALIALTRSAAKSLAGIGIRVNSVAPGVAIWQDGVDEDLRRRVLEQIPLHRAGTPEGIAEAVLFLASHDYITGQNLRVDGGWHMG